MLDSAIQLKALPPLSLYIHFPWCERKCPYCDFNSHQVKDGGFDEKRYIQALIADLQTELPNIRNPSSRIERDALQVRRP